MGIAEQFVLVRAGLLDDLRQPEIRWGFFEIIMQIMKPTLANRGARALTLHTEEMRKTTDISRTVEMDHSNN